MRKRLKINQFLFGFIFFIIGALTVSILSVSHGGESSSFLEIEKRLIFNSIDLLPEEKNDPWIMGSNLYYIAHRGQIVQHAIDPDLPNFHKPRFQLLFDPEIQPISHSESDDPIIFKLDDTGRAFCPDSHRLFWVQRESTPVVTKEADYISARFDRNYSLVSVGLEHHGIFFDFDQYHRLPEQYQKDLGLSIRNGFLYLVSQKKAAIGVVPVRDLLNDSEYITQELQGLEEASSIIASTMSDYHLATLHKNGGLYLYHFIDPYQVQKTHAFALPEVFLETYPPNTLKVIYDEAEDTLVLWSHEVLSPRSNRGDRSHYFYISKGQNSFEKIYLDPHYNYSFLYNSMKDNKEVLMLMVNRFDPKDLTLLSLDKIGIRMENFYQKIYE